MKRCQIGGASVDIPAYIGVICGKVTFRPTHFFRATECWVPNTKMLESL